MSPEWILMKTFWNGGKPTNHVFLSWRKLQEIIWQFKHLVYHPKEDFDIRYTNGIEVKAFRNRLNPENVQSLMCLHSWFKIK